MKTRIPVRLISLLMCSVSTSAIAATRHDEIVLLSFFRDNGQDGVFLAASEDGLHFKALNDDKPVMKPARWEGQRLTRDPSMVFHDGKFHAVWTSNWSGNCFGYAESADLVHWSEPLKVEPFRAAPRQPGNVWAPEICWDPIQKNYLIFWSSTVDSRGHRIYCTRTSDGKNFSEAKIFLDPKYSCIDGMMALEETAATSRWILVYKNEEEPAKGGKNLRLATAPVDLSQPWSLAAAPLAGPGSTIRPNELAEGPSLLKLNNTWYLYWDAFANGHYSLATSTDLQNWTDRTSDLQLPPHPRHGTVFRAPRSAVGWLQARKPPDEAWFLLTSHVDQKDGLHLAVSPDGLKWQLVNGDKSVLKPGIPGVFRDPSIARDESGTYHLVWTIAWGCRQYKGIGYASSRNLINWSEERIIPVMENEPKAEFIWAPELFWDGGKKEWMIHWSSSVTGKYPETLALFDGHSNPRIYYTITKDFKKFTPSKLLFNADCLAIDSYVYAGDDQNYYVFFKADRKETPKRGILMAKASTPTGPYVLESKMITTPEEGWAEGPCAIKVGGKTRLYYAPPNDFGAYESTDMKNWTSIRKEMVPPGGYRHGTVIRISAEEAQRLLHHEY